MFFCMLMMTTMADRMGHTSFAQATETTASSFEADPFRGLRTTYAFTQTMTFLYQFIPRFT